MSGLFGLKRQSLKHFALLLVTAVSQKVALVFKENHCEIRTSTLVHRQYVAFSLIQWAIWVLKCCSPFLLPTPTLSFSPPTFLALPAPHSLPTLMTPSVGARLIRHYLWTITFDLSLSLRRKWQVDALYIVWSAWRYESSIFYLVTDVNCYMYTLKSQM